MVNDVVNTAVREGRQEAAHQQLQVTLHSAGQQQTDL